MTHWIVLATNAAIAGFSFAGMKDREQSGLNRFWYAVFVSLAAAAIFAEFVR